MTSYKMSQLEGVPVVLDGNEFEACVLRNCVLIYRGGPLPKLSNSVFEGCQWRFEDAAERTVAFLKAIAEAMGPEGRTLIENTFLRGLGEAGGSETPSAS